ncbi:VWA domain-containing protein [Stieleria sp. ICT_E10.1]|uniref:vWA domain-containing protein n=1 Tax=Stieleria sedimenti TaxID=2976331 RepID=UPI00218014D3|nr:vWA domain-containing protein [Stieleria sedimenti]MCS7469546.1 VWA domain-containing protein [Stieleria sedimenti]
MSTSPIQPAGNTKKSTRSIWQGDRSSGVDVFGFLWRRSRQFLWGALLLAALLLFVWLIWLLLLSPKRTPMVVLSAAPYSWPLPPNAWAKEDFEKLAAMDGETITLRGSDDPVFKATDFYQRLEREIKRAEGQSHRVPLIVWVSLHGVAESSGGAIHLIPPKAAMTDPKSWIDLDALLDRFEQLGAKRKALLILDCNRMQVNWNIGLAANQFADKVQATFRDRVAAKKTTVDLAVLLSAGPEQTSHVSADLAGSVFGHYLQHGLAGAADQMANRGNGDGWVDLKELDRYVRSHVQWWVRQSRGAIQHPILMTTTSKSDFRLARSLNPELLKQLTSRPVTRRPGPTISDPQLDALWRSLDQIREAQLYRHEPIAFRDLEHDLLWLEQLSGAGKGYQTLAKRTFNRVVGDITAAEHRMAQLPQNPTYAAAYSLLSGDPPPLPRSLSVHSLSLAEFFGTQDVISSTQLRDRWKELSDQPDAGLLAKVHDAFQTQATSNYRDAHFIRMLDRYQTPRLWQQPELLGKLLTLQGSIEDLSVPRDTTGIPSDLRVHRWKRVLLGPIDAARRRAEDSVFLRLQNGLEDSVRETESKYAASLEAANRAAATMQICDQSMAVTPYYAQWIAHPNRAMASKETQEAIDNLVLPLIVNTQQLAAQLDTVPHAAADQQAVIESIRAAHAFADKSIQPVMGSLAESLTLRTRQLVRQSLTNELTTIGEIEAVLSVPLVDWESRRQLRTARNEMIARVQQTLDAPSAEDTESADEPAPAYSARIAGWNQHPLDLLLGGERTRSDGGNKNRIANFVDSVGREMKRFETESTLEGEHQICGGAARRMRAAAAIWFPRPESDPIAKLRTVGIKSLLVWHADRAIGDFWGPAGRERPFFDLAASDYLESAAELDRLWKDSAGGGDRLVEIEAAKTRIEASRQFLPNWLATSAPRTIQLNPVDAVRSSFVVSSEPGDAAADRFTPPSGTATVAVRTETRRLDFQTIEPSDAFVLSSANARYEVVMPSEVATSDMALKAQTVFRGHEYGGTLDVEQLGGLKIDLQPYHYQKSEVTLNGPWDELSVVFVLDCSASMSEPLDGESEEAEGEGGASRMEVAKAALQEMLFDLGLRRNVRVGVQAFGHRLGWSVDEPIKLLTRPDFTGPIDPTLTPERDVESILTLSEFDLATAQSLVPEISDLKPWGQSPLYLSVMRSIQEFSAADAKADRHVIAITDGANYQYIPSSVTNVSATSDDDVREAWTHSQVPVHILGLGMDRTQQRDAVQAFENLSRETGGRFQALGSSTDLKQAVRNLLAPGMYRLRSYQNAERPEMPTTLATPTQVIPAPAAPELFALQYEGRQWVDTAAADADRSPLAVEPVVLEGGEAYQLYVNEAGTEIYDYAYDDNVEAMADLVTTEGIATEQVVRVHRAIRRAPGQIDFPVSWQQRDSAGTTDQPLWRATRRPSDVWIQVQPVGVDGSAIGQAYAFFDATFQPGEPVPVMNLVANDWPATAARARLRIWSRPAEEATTIELLPPAVATGGNLNDPGRGLSRLNTTITVDETSNEPVEVTPGIQVRIDPLGTQFVDGVARRRYVVDFFDPDVPVTSIKISLRESIDEKPVRIVRQFDPERRMSVHTFYYRSRRNEPIRQVRVTNRDQEIDGAWKLDRDYVEVAIPNAGGLLPVGR